MMTARRTPLAARAFRDRRRRILLALSSPALLTGCRASSETRLPDPVLLDVPAPTGAAEPNVVAWGERFAVSWIEPDTASNSGAVAGAPPGTPSAAPPDSSNGGDVARGRPSSGDRTHGHRLRFAVFDGSGWTEPRTIAHGTGWFVNWADFPSLLPLDERTLVAHWLQRSAASPYAYDVMVTRSVDGGATWSAPVRPHRDGTASEHGFVSFIPMGAGAGLVWLDGRRFTGPDATKEMTVRFTTLDATGSLGDEVLLDDRACDCCQTAAAVTSDGPLVAYRDRTADEIRDIAVTRLVDGRWTTPRPLHADGWRINACPVNGPQADAIGRDVVVAWYTAAKGRPRVQVAFSSDAGATFGTPIRVDQGTPLGRVDVVLTGRDNALVVWLERAGEAAEVRARRVAAGRSGAVRIVAATSAQRASGFPRLARHGSRAVLAWTDALDPAGPAVRAATFELPH